MLYNKKRKIKKSASDFLHVLTKKYSYAKDRLTEQQIQEIQSIRQALGDLMKSTVESAEDLQREFTDLELRASKIFRPDPQESMKEWVEVFLVAAVIAISFKTYFLQPFKIPTNSMYPTLYGIVPTVLAEDVPLNPLPQRIWNTVIQGKFHHRVVAKESGIVESIEQGKWLGIPFFDVTRIRIGGQTHTIHTQKLHFEIGTRNNPLIPQKTRVEKGQVIANFITETGDHLFVNKMAYHFRKPEQGEVFVFTTNGIWGIESQNRRRGIRGGQFYIKRCVGVPGVQLNLQVPKLFSNGELLNNRPIFEKIYSQQEGYGGYTYGETFLTGPNSFLLLKKNQYWAMGDNSANSLDSRSWGPVPRSNLVGTGLWVYWPFTKRWGLID